MTVFENMLVAQHNMLMAASGYTFIGVFAPHIYGRAEKAAVEKARYWLEKTQPDRSRRRPGRRSALWRAAPARNRARDVHRSGAALPRRARRRPQSAREPRPQRASALDPAGARDLDPADRARHVGRDADFRSCRRARLRREDFRRHAGSRAQRPEGRSPPISASRTKKSRRSRRRWDCDHSPPRRARREDLLRQYPRAEGRRHRCRRRRDRHADRRERRRQVDPDDDDLRQSARARRLDRVRRPRHHAPADARDRAAAHRAGAGRPPHLLAHDRAGKSPDGRGRRRATRISSRTWKRSSRCFRA